MKPTPKIKKISSPKLSKKLENTSAANDSIVQVLQALPISAAIISLNKILFVNQCVVDVLKLSKTDEKNITSFSLFDFILPQYHPLIIKIFKDLTLGKEFKPIELKIKNKKNQIIDIEVKSNVILYNNELVLQAVFTDISKQIKFRNKLVISKKDAEKKWINYKNLLDASPVGVYIHHSGICIYCNQKGVQILEESSIDSVINKYLIDYIVPEQRSISIERIKEINSNRKLDSYIYKLVTAKNNIIEVELKTVVFMYNGKKCLQTTISDISIEKKLIEEKLKTRLAEKTNAVLIKVINERNATQAKLNTIFNTSTHIIWTVDANYKLSSFNKNYQSQVLKYYNFNIHSKNSIDFKKLYKDLLNDEDYNIWMNKYELAFKGENIIFETEKKLPDGSFIYREVYLNPTFDENQKVVEVVAISHNITKRKIDEQKLQEQSAKLQAIFESGDQLMWTISKDFILTSLNNNYASAIFDLYGFYPQVGKSIREIGKDKVKPFESIWDDKYSQAFSGKQVQLSTERIKLHGDKVYRQYYLYPIKNINNQVVEVSGIGFNVTENKQNEEKIIQSLKEKEILLKEVHHRVKNNMQVISSILNLQSSYVNDAYALNLLKECQNRIKSMAFIHESLYQTKNFESVNFSEYLTTLTKNLVHTYSVNAQKVKLILTLDNLFLNLDSSIPCGLIINEIISNSLKYAFPNNLGGIIFVTLKVNKQKVTIEVGDNGIGIPETMDIKNTPTLGLQLVNTLIEQIGASFKLETTKGTKFIIQFNTNS